MDLSRLIHEPWSHQADELNDYWDSPARALLWQMRTGKTKVVIDAVGGWYSDKGLRTVIIVAPNGVHENWVRKEFPKHAFFEYEAHAWCSRRVGTKKHQWEVQAVLSTQRLAVLAFGKESILSPKVQAAIKLALRRGPCSLVVDESHHFGKAGAKRTKLVRGLSKKCAMRRILSGTASGNSPLRLFSQFDILSPGALGFTRYTGPSGFEARYAIIGEGYDPRSGRRFKTIDGYQRQTELQGRVARWSSVVLREDCEDLPDVIVSRHYYEPTSLQLAIYESIRKDYMAELKSGSMVEAVDSGTRLLRLQQTLSNFAVNDAFEIETVDPSSDPRMEALIQLLDSPTIIWCRFVEDIRRVKKRLELEGFKVSLYYGAVKDVDRTKAYDDFVEGRTTIFLGQPACAGEGLDLSAADTIVWYSHVFDVVSRDQATERATMMGGNNVSVIDLTVADSVDEYILSNLEDKRSVADTVTGHELRDILERCKI